jgi:hypothetical protein
MPATCVAEPTTACSDCGDSVPASEVRDCDTCGRALCEGCTDKCTGFAGTGCRACHLARCTSRDCWD